MDCGLQVRTLICGWLARLLRMSRPGKSESESNQQQQQLRDAAATRRLMPGSVRGRQSNSLLANGLSQSDLHLRYRSAKTHQHYSHSTNARHPSATSPAGTDCFSMTALLFTGRQHSLLCKCPVLAMAEVSVCVSVCPSVTPCYSIETMQARITKSSPSAP